MSDDIGQSVRDRLAATTAVTKIVRADRIFADVLEQTTPNAEAAIVVIVAAHNAHEVLNSSERCYSATVQVYAYGKDRAEANRLAKVIRDEALPADLSGSLHGMDWKEVSLVEGPSEVVDEPPDGSARWRRITQQTFSIWAHAL